MDLETMFFLNFLSSLDDDIEEELLRRKLEQELMPKLLPTPRKSKRSFLSRLFSGGS